MSFTDAINLEFDVRWNFLSLSNFHPQRETETHSVLGRLLFPFRSNRRRHFCRGHAVQNSRLLFDSSTRIIKL